MRVGESHRARNQPAADDHRTIDDHDHHHDHHHSRNEFIDDDHHGAADDHDPADDDVHVDHDCQADNVNLDDDVHVDHDCQADNVNLDDNHDDDRTVDDHDDDHHHRAQDDHDDEHEHVVDHDDDDHQDQALMMSHRAGGALRQGRAFWLMLLGIVLVWLAARVIYWNGYYVEDAPGYVTDAVYAALGNYHARDYITGLNVGTYLPVALPLAWFGKAELALSLWPLVCSLTGLLSLVGAGTMLFGRGYGLLGGLLYATYPGDVFFSTVVMPDAVQAGWLALSVFLVVWGYAGAAPQRFSRLAAGGGAMGMCSLIRGNGPILLPIAVFAAVVLALEWKAESVRTAVRDALVLLSAYAVVLAIEGFAYLWATGDFFHRFHVVNAHYGSAASIARWGLNTDPRTIPFSVLPPLGWWTVGGWGSLNADQAYHGFVFCLALAGVVLGALAIGYRRAAQSSRAVAAFWLAAFWFAWPLLYHQFGTQSMTEFVPIHRLSRHLVVYAPGAMFAIVASCFVIGKAISTWRAAMARRAIWTAALATLVLHLFFSWQGELIAFTGFHEIKNRHVRIRDRLPRDVQTVVGDPGDLAFLEFWLNPLGVERVRLTPFADYSRCEELPSGVVLTRSNPGWDGLSAQVIRETVTRLPCLLQPPATWHLLYGGYPEKIYVVGRAELANTTRTGLVAGVPVPRVVACTTPS